MDIQARLGSITSHTFWSPKQRPISCSSYSSSNTYSPLVLFCSQRKFQQPQNNDNNNNNNNNNNKGAAFSFLEFIQSRIPRGGGSDTSHWCLKGNGKFDAQSYYKIIRGAAASNFPWKGIWKAKIPRRVAFFVWTTVHGQILTLDNLKLRGRILANRCCMCHRNEETVDYLLLHCPVAHSLWVYMFQIFGTQWVMPGNVESLVYCWSFWLGKFNSDIWNMVLGCLTWIVWT